MPEPRVYAASAAAVVAIGLGAGAWFAFSGPTDILAECGGGTAVGAQLGGPFTLVDHTGAEVTEADVIDRPTLLYFGYAFCPDVCPMDVAVMAEAARILETQGHDVKTAFVTIDPARDTQDVLADFVGNMHPDMIGLRGDDEATAKAAKAYRVYYQKAETDDPEYYLMDHSAFTYLTAPGIGFLDLFRHGVSPDEIAETTACYAEALSG